jgi:hypothetical protein
MQEQSKNLVPLTRVSSKNDNHHTLILATLVMLTLSLLAAVAGTDAYVQLKAAYPHLTYYPDSEGYTNETRALRHLPIMFSSSITRGTVQLRCLELQNSQLRLHTRGRAWYRLRCPEVHSDRDEICGSQRWSYTDCW